jgi:hypothetical protein
MVSHRLKRRGEHDNQRAAADLLALLPASRRYRRPLEFGLGKLRRTTHVGIGEE